MGAKANCSKNQEPLFFWLEFKKFIWQNTQITEYWINKSPKHHVLLIFFWRNYKSNRWKIKTKLVLLGSVTKTMDSILHIFFFHWNPPTRSKSIKPIEKCQANRHSHKHLKGNLSGGSSHRPSPINLNFDLHKFNKL